MKRLFFLAALCGAVMLGGCLETTYQNKKTTDNTTTNTTTDGKGDSNTTNDNGNKNNGKTFHSNNGKFSINFVNPPDGPIVKEENTKAGIIQTIQYIDQVSNSGIYVAMYKDYPSGAIKADEVDDKLKLEANNFLKNYGGAKADKTAEERLNGNKGLSFSGSLNDTIKINMRSYFVGKRYYQFGTIATSSAISDKDSKKFISSFEID